MSGAKLNEALLESFRTAFPASLLGTWSTFGDDYQLDFGHAVTFQADGTGSLETWGLLDNDEASRTVLFRWQVKQPFELEVKPLESDETTEADDWGTFRVEFYQCDDAYGNQFVAIRDGNGTNGRKPFWWFANPDKHPLRRFE